MKYFFLTLMLSMTVAHHAYAQKGGIASQTLNISLGDVIDIKFVSNEQNSGPQLQMVFSTAEDYYRGIESQQQMLKVRSNKDFTVSVRASNLSANGTSNPVPPFVYIKVPQNSTGGQLAQSMSNTTYQKLTENDILLLEDGQKGENQTFTVQYKAKPGTMVDPGVYMIDVVFTATRN